MDTEDDFTVQQSKNSWLKWNNIHPMVYQCLLENNKTNPTDVQSSILATYKHYNDFIIASQTGSGKTFSFGVPILSEILFEKNKQKAQSSDNKQQNTLKGLIVAPTRELALQIEKQLKLINAKTEKLVTIIALVGGISKEKQLRLLKYQPDIIVATPGRLWDLIDEDQHPYLQNINQIKYLVMDEADRMIEMGHFEDLDKILSYIFQRKVINHDKEIIKQLTQKKGQGEAEVEYEGADDGIEEKNLIEILENQVVEMDQEQYMKQMKNQGKQQYDVEEVTLEQLNEFKEGLEGEEQLDENEVEEEEEEEGEEEQEEEEEEEGEEEEEEEEEEEDSEQSQEMEEDEEVEDEGVDDEEVEEENEEEEEEEQQEGEEENNYEIEQVDNKEILQNQQGRKANMKRKVFLVSATITQHFKGKTKFKLDKKKLDKQRKRKQDKEEKNQKKDGHSDKMQEREEQFNLKIEALLQKIKFSGKPKIVDLTSKTLFPEKLREIKSASEEEDKILYLYHYIQQNIDQNFLIFCNSISYSKKVSHLLEVLNLKNVMLHSEMQQRQRLKKLEQFVQKKINILVCTDVAARGLDIPKVNNVIHYQVPMDIDTYVHRSGRTARIGQDGVSYVLIGPQDSGRYNQLCKQLGKSTGIEGVDMTQSEKNKIKTLIDSAIEYEKKQFQLKKKQQESVWYKKVSKSADIELDEDIIHELNEIEDDISKKRVITKKSKDSFMEVAKDNKNIDRKRRNALIMDTQQIQNFAEKIKRIKQKQAENLIKQQEKKLLQQQQQPTKPLSKKKQKQLKKAEEKKKKQNKQ